LIASVNAKDIPSRVVSLSPAHTQTLIDLGLEDKIVCAAKPFNALRTKREFKNVGFYHKPSVELIISCKPDLIITTYAGTPPEVYDKLKASGYNILVDRPKDLNSIKNFIIKLSDIFKIKRPKILKSFDTVCKKYVKHTGVMIIGLDPLIVVGNDSFVSDALRCSGIKNLVPGLYPRLNIEKVLSYKNDILIVAVKDFNNFKDYRLISGSFKGRIIYIDPDKILLPSTGIIKGIEELSSKI
jgi:iron complex transport system substrate-binding protein